MVCMKTRGQIVREWREARQMNARQLAKAIGTSRQNIENLEKDVVDQPKYLPALSRFMGYASVEELLALKEPPQSGPALAVEEGDAPQGEEGDFVPTSEEEWRLFQAYKLLSPELQQKHLAEVEADAMMEMGRKLFQDKLRAKGFATDEKVARHYGTPPEEGTATPGPSRGWTQMESPTNKATPAAKKRQGDAQ
jgi:transcriptional regulator with XRE-family HTH domain